MPNPKSWLHPEEQLLLNRECLSEKRKNEFLLGRWAAKQAVIEIIPNLRLKEIAVLKGALGQPVLSVPCAENWSVSISHAENQAAALLFPEAFPMGLDIECKKSNIYQTVESALSRKERLQVSISSDKNLCALQIWSAKEALAKVLKLGFSLSPQILEVSNISKEKNHLRAFYQKFDMYNAQFFLLADMLVALCFPNENMHPTTLSLVEHY
ncbi:MAG: 4'-phosphopantetheinyl transferase superfamily protein [Cytophagales bacterium]|nr:4'-phosphopantetheinyl transferase superfamily protein [Cytophagales bacterium]